MSSGSNSSSGHNANPPFFISHGGRDREIVNVILRIFEQHNQFTLRGRPHRVIDRDVLSRSKKPHWEPYVDLVLQPRISYRRIEMLKVVLYWEIIGREDH